MKKIRAVCFTVLLFCVQHTQGLSTRTDHDGYRRPSEQALITSDILTSLQQRLVMFALLSVTALTMVCITHGMVRRLEKHN